MDKMWAGRFVKALDKQADDFNSSIRFDARMYKQDICGSMAHAAMLASQKIIGESDAEAIIEGLASILSDIENGSLEIDENAEDIHMFVEAVLTERIGDTGKKLHTARSRNDQVAVDIRLYLRDEAEEIISQINIIPNPSSNPGITPATNNLVTERPVRVPATIIGRLGGIIGPIQLDAAVIAQEKSVS